jgi:adenylate kinase
VTHGTELGKRARVIMDAGDLVSDEIVIAMVKERLAQEDTACGFLLDGFPRTAPQAGALEQVIAETPLDGVIVLEVPEGEIVDRTLTRGRSDDTAESVRTRLASYHEQTAPLISFYEARGDMARVDGVGTIDEVLARIVGELAR